MTKKIISTREFDPDEMPIVVVPNSEGDLIQLRAAFALSIGQPHLDEGEVKAPIIIISNGGTEETEHIGVYFYLDSAQNAREIAKGLMEVADEYERMVRENVQ
jgi:hypothetical protein